MKYLTLVTILFSCILGASVALATQNYAVLEDASKVDFLAIGKPSMIKIMGSKAKVAGTFNIPQGGVIQVNLNTIDTGMALRNKHMKEKYLQTGVPENAIATYKISKIELPSGGLPQSGEVKGRLQGTLTLHGVSKEMPLEAVFNMSGGNIVAQTKFILKISDYKIDVPSFAGVTVAEDVELDVKIEAKKVELYSGK